MTKAELLQKQFLRFANVQDILSKQIHRELLQGYGNSELNCIDCIGHTRHPNTSVIAQKMSFTRSAISKIMKKLVDKGVAVPYQIEGNQKEIYYRLTPYGRELFRQHAMRHNSWEKRDTFFFNSLDESMLDTVLQFMNAYNGYLELKMTTDASLDPYTELPDTEDADEL